MQRVIKTYLVLLLKNQLKKYVLHKNHQKKKI